VPTPISERQWLVNVAGISGLFQTKSGGVTDVEHTKEFDGGALEPDIYPGPPMVDDLTVSRPYKAPRDTQVVRELRRVLDRGQRFDTVVTCKPTDAALAPIGAAEVYDVTLKRVSAPEANARSSNPSRLELTFTVKRVR
jgi:hypothetical protein